MEPTIFPEDSVLKLFNLRNLFSCNTSFKKTELDTKTCNNKFTSKFNSTKLLYLFHCYQL